MVSPRWRYLHQMNWWKGSIEDNTYENFKKKKYLTNIVRQVTHHTPKSIIDQYVILLLKMQLKRSSQSIKEVAWEYHFADTSFFCRYFKKHTGITPQQIREK